MEQPTTADALHELQEKDTFAAIELICAGGDPLAGVKLFADLLHHFYAKKDLAFAIAFGRAGAEYGLAEAQRLAQTNAELAAQLRGAAKPLCYNIASFTWPGWDEPGIQIGPGELAVGMDAAKANLRLAIELQRGDLPMSRAYWLVGAHALARGNFQEARRLFEQAVKRAQAATEKGDELLAVGYGYLTQILEEPDNAGAADSFTQIKRDLQLLPDGNFFVEQLDTALRVFRNVKPNPAPA